MANVNKVILIGNLTRDPQLRYTPNQMAVCEFGLATNRKWRNKAGEMQDEVCFVDLVAWGKQAETIQKYVTKGQQIFIEGRLTFDQWEGKDGQKRSRLRVTVDNFQFLGAPKGGGGGSKNSSGGEEGGQGGGGPRNSSGGEEGGQGGQGGGDYQYNQDLGDDTIPF